MFKSVAQNVGKNCVGAILTGMGKDGADGMLLMRNQGARTIAQDERSSVVYGMPKVANENGGAEFVAGLDTIADKIKALL